MTSKPATPGLSRCRVLASAFSTGYALFSCDIGTPRNMGAGMFPFVIGTMIALFGLGFAAPTLLELSARSHAEGRAGPLGDDPAARHRRRVVACSHAFTALVGPFGMIPATLAMTKRSPHSAIAS